MSPKDVLASKQVAKKGTKKALISSFESTESSAVTVTSSNTQ